MSTFKSEKQILADLKEENKQAKIKLSAMSKCIESFIKDFEGDYMMPNGDIVDNPSTLLMTNYEMFKNLKNIIK